MGVFSNLSQVKTFEKSKWFQPGKYLVEIEEIKFIESGNKGDSFVIQGKVIAVESEHAAAPKVGETAANVWNASGEKRNIGLSSWKSFLQAAFGKDEINAMDDEALEELSGSVIDDGALDGMPMLLDVWMTETKAGGNFTKHDWKRPATPEDFAEFGLDIED